MTDIWMLIGVSRDLLDRYYWIKPFDDKYEQMFVGVSKGLLNIHYWITPFDDKHE